MNFNVHSFPIVGSKNFVFSKNLTQSFWGDSLGGQVHVIIVHVNKPAQVCQEISNQQLDWRKINCLGQNYQVLMAALQSLNMKKLLLLPTMSSITLMWTTTTESYYGPMGLIEINKKNIF